LKQKEMQHVQAFKEFEKFGSSTFEAEANDEEVEIKFEEESADYYDGIDLPSENDDDVEEVAVAEEEINVDDI